MGSSLGRFDDAIRVSFERIRKKFKRVGVENLSDRQLSKIMANIFEEFDFDIKRTKIRKRKDKFEIIF